MCPVGSSQHPVGQVALAPVTEVGTEECRNPHGMLGDARLDQDAIEDWRAVTADPPQGSGQEGGFVSAGLPPPQDMGQWDIRGPGGLCPKPQRDPLPCDPCLASGFQLG